MSRFSPARLFVASILLIALPAAVSAGDSVPGYPNAGHWPYGPSWTSETWSDGANDLLVYGDGSAVRIADVSIPATPELLGDVDIGTPVWHLDILADGSMIAASDREKWVTLIDLSTPSAPTILGRFEVEDGRRPYGLDFGAPGTDRLYVAVSPAGLWVLDISDPSLPAIDGTYVEPGTDFVFDVEVLGDYAFLADDVEGVSAIDLVTLELSTRHLGADGASHLTIEPSTGRCYVSRRGDGLQVLDLDVDGDDAVITELGNLDQSLLPQGFGVTYRTEVRSDGRVVMADGINGNGLHLLDASAPTSIAVDASFTTSMFSVSVLGDLAFGSRPEGIGIAEISVVDFAGSRGSGPSQVGSIPVFGKAFDVEVFDDGIVVSGDNGGAVVLDTTDPANPVAVSTIALGFDSVFSAVRIGTTLAVATRSGDLRLFDLTAPGTPVELTPFDLGPGATAYHVERFGNASSVAVATNLGGIHIVDLTDPETPVETSSWQPVSGGVVRIAPDGDRILAAGNTDVWLVDFSTLAVPVEAEAFTVGQTVLDLDLEGDLAYIAAGVDGLRIWDLSDPGNPQEAGSFDPLPITANGVEVRGTTAYLAADEFYGFFLLDVSNPAAPVESDRIDTPGQARAVAADAEILALADGDAGILLWGQPFDPSIFADDFETGDTGAWGP